MVAVITGASSGIGRATALKFASKGWSVVLAARFGPALETVAEACKNLGGRALAVPMDVTREEEVEALALLATEAFGSFDVWVNNAAVGLFGRFDEIPTEDIRQLMDVNLFGYIYGARAAVQQFKGQGHGTLINVASVAALVGQPFSIPYSMSKYAVRGMSISLAQELANYENIHVCCVLPAVIDTPIFQHAANYMGKAVQPPKPIVPAEKVANVIYKLTKKPQEQVSVGSMAKFMKAQRYLLPAEVFDKMHRENIRSQHFAERPSGPYEGNLYEPVTNWNKVTGGWLPDKKKKKDLPKRTRKAPILGALLLAGTAIGIRLFSRQKTEKQASG